MTRRLEEEYPYLILDARYERVRENGVGHSRAVLITLSIGWDGRRHMLSVELANRESATSWKDHLVRLKERGLHGVRLAASDDHAGLKRAIMETHGGGSAARSHPMARPLPLHPFVTVLFAQANDSGIRFR